MYRVLVIAVFLAATVFPSRLEGQTRAMQRPSGPVRISVAPHFRAVQPPPGRLSVISPRPFGRRALLVRPGAFHHHLPFRTFFGNSCFTDPFFDPFFCRRFFFRNRFFFAQPVFLPYPVYTAPYYQVAEQAPATVADRDTDLAREVERLRDERLSREQSRQPRTSVEEKTATTILVFRDGRRSEVQNFAIVGRTFWVFTEQRARKVPISDLDVEATSEVNAGRGVDFRLP
jgi:hypothetical protein